MSTRSTETVVVFRQPFFLTPVGEPLPPGSYRLVVDEALIDGLSFQAWRRVATMLHVPAIEISATARQVYVVDPDELDAALSADQSLPQTEPDTIESQR